MMGRRRGVYNRYMIKAISGMNHIKRPIFKKIGALFGAATKMLFFSVKWGFFPHPFINRGVIGMPNMALFIH